LGNVTPYECICGGNQGAIFYSPLQPMKRQTLLHSHPEDANNQAEEQTPKKALFVRNGIFQELQSVK
jgi:hypothetical protein